jgi:putative Ca2+/H+ antiporter (TMEM165/GDT1 family)
VLALFARESDDGEVRERSGHGVFVTTFLMIFLAEFGDKTQLATAGLSAAAPPLPVWVGSTLALALTSALGVMAGRTVLQRLPLSLLHRLSGLLFLALAGYVLWDLWSSGELVDWRDALIQFLQ